jgi:predicted cupin superfamily sugar epimerase
MTRDEAQHWVAQLGLQPHPEGGWFSECYRSQTRVTHGGQERLAATSIYFLLGFGAISRLHRLKFDELWYYHAGDALRVELLHGGGQRETVWLGPRAEAGERLQLVVPGGTVFGARAAEEGASLVGCMVAPAFEFADFEMPTRAQLLKDFPKQCELIEELGQ